MLTRRRATYGGNPEDVTDFDYMPPNEHLMAPTFENGQSNLQSSDFLRNMFNMPLPSNEAPLVVSTDLLPAHQIVSPSSSMGTNSSGPSSPTVGPFTPTLSVHPHPAFAFNGLSSNVGVSDTQAQAEMDLQMQMSPSFDFSGYSWSTTAWQDETNVGLLHSDFDLNSVPSLEIGGPKYAGEYATSPQIIAPDEYSQEYQYPSEFMAEYQPDYVQFEHGQYFEGQHSTESSLLGYDDVMNPSKRF